MITTYREAIQMALADEMEADSRVVLLGEDVGHAGGPFKVSEGLYDRFGDKRVIDTPIAETGFVGAALGMAITGLRPIAEVMFSDFLFVCMDQIVNSAAKYRFMSGGQTDVPMVIRTACGGGIRFGAQHSQVGESWLMQFPGLKICCPSNPHDAYHLLKEAIRDNNPVMFFEHKAMYAKKGELNTGATDVKMGQAHICRSGSDITLVATLSMVGRALEAAKILEKQGVSAEVIDLRTLRPLDTNSVLASVAKTHNLLTIEENHGPGGWGAEVIATVVSEGFDHLDAPPKRITLLYAPIGFSPVLEDKTIPSVDRIVKQVKEMLGFNHNQQKEVNIFGTEVT